MDDQLVGVILGGLIAIVSGAIGPWIQHRLAANERKADAKRQSALDIVDAIFSHNDYSEKLRRTIAFGEDLQLPPNPLARIEGLVATDFPQCSQELASFRYAASAILVWATNFNIVRVNGKPLSADGWSEIIRQYTLASSNLIAAVTGRTQMTNEQVWGKALEADSTEAIAERTSA